MSWGRQVKSIYTATNLMFVFILYCVLEMGLLKENINIKAYGIMLIGVFFMQYLNSKEKNRVVVITFPIILTAAISLMLYSVENFIINTIVVAVIIAFFEKKDKANIDYDYYKRVMIIKIYMLFLVGIISVGVINSNVYWKINMIFLALVAVTLRQCRNYCNNVKNRKSTIADFLIVGVGSITCTNIGFSIINKLLYFISLPIDFVISKLAFLMFAILYLPLKFIYLILKFIYIVLKTAFSKSVISEKTENPLNKFLSIIEDWQKDPSNVGNILVMKILMAIVLICCSIIIYRLYKKLIRSKSLKNGVATEELKRERLKYKKKKKYAVTNLFNRLFGRDGTLREQVIYTYRRFQMHMKLLDIFRPFMTATQLSNISKNKIDDVEALDSIKNIYNEAKFSKHEISKESLDRMCAMYSRIKNDKFN